MWFLISLSASWVALVVKNLPASAGDVREAGSIAWCGRSPGGGNGNPLQHSFPENPTDRGVWWAMVQRVTKSQTHWSNLAWTHACMISVSNDSRQFKIFNAAI